MIVLDRVAPEQRNLVVRLPAPNQIQPQTSQEVIIMSHLIDLTGQTFGRLIVIKQAKPVKHGQHAMWECLCNCGNASVVDGGNLKKGYTKSCGCLGAEKRKESVTTHGLSHTPEYKAWINIIKRCTDKGGIDFELYGGRGIKICDEWRHNFPEFFKHIGKRPSKKYTVERIDNNKGYKPGNVKWATSVEQANNKRSNRLITFEGITMTLAQWGKHSNINYWTLKTRLQRDWPFSRAISEPIHYR